jgi:hypothetical protein
VHISARENDFVDVELDSSETAGKGNSKYDGDSKNKGNF